MKEITAMSNCSLLKDSFEDKTDEQALSWQKYLFRQIKNLISL